MTHANITFFQVWSSTIAICVTRELPSNHQYSGFAADAPDNALESLSTQHAQYKPEIEEDKVVTANGDYAAAS